MFLLNIAMRKTKVDRLPQLAAELVNLKVDVIVVGGGTTRVAKNATSTIPIVVGSAGYSGRGWVGCQFGETGWKRHGIDRYFHRT